MNLGGSDPNFNSNWLRIAFNTAIPFISRMIFSKMISGFVFGIKFPVLTKLVYLFFICYFFVFPYGYFKIKIITRTCVACKFKGVLGSLLWI